MAPRAWNQPGERRATAQYRNGTMATLRPVMKPDLPGVVYCRPIVCRTRAVR